MKRVKLFWIVLVVMALGHGYVPSCALAAPAKLTADCSLAADNVIGAQLQFDNSGTWIDVPVFAVCAGATETVNCTAPSVTLCYDTLPNGPHTVVARWKNIFDVGATSSPPFSFNKAIPSGSPLLRIK